ncbi:glycoside hydrolase family 36 protein [Homoserinibacter sp. GY 40078]|uniref:glycoside hydrolase family 36 protein n=1 Tax=Homoserinibacter sp. GY 40078 TaxID=2603275 RepID=UPI002102E4F8|nr:glycoside hydrolase family 36 protein [Homoserinibacter sp. GY 40078]
MSLHVGPQVDELVWGVGPVQLVIRLGGDLPPAVSAVRAGGIEHHLYATPAVEILTVDGGHTPASARLNHTEVGANLRYVAHDLLENEGTHRLSVHVASSDLEATWHLEQVGGAPAFRSWVSVHNAGSTPIGLRSVASWVAGFTREGVGGGALAGWDLVDGASDWLGESRWNRIELRSALPRLREELTGHNPRGALIRTSTGTWSTGRVSPQGFLESDDLAWGWQVEHNGAWRSEVGEDTRGGYLALSGPTDDDSSWFVELAPGDDFETVPVAVSAGTGLDDVVANLTRYRRIARRQSADNIALPVVFNDYMNTLNGDPTTDRLLPLIAAAAEVGAEIFCIDAGWYDDSGYWWDSVGAWLPSTTRFPRGLGEVITAIRDAGMVPGLWLEPEVVGVRSPMADILPNDAFLQRRGVRLVEHARYHLDLRHPAAIAHLDGVVDRLVDEFGIGFFKFDYNVDPGPGTDLDADSVGDGLLQHNRAHLAWLDRLLERHPDLVIENCSSGAMRSDFAMLSRLAMQSTSDQQDYRLFPPIAASAPFGMLPEQAANWAYPQPEMTDEEVAFCMVTGLLGRLYLSGYLNNMRSTSRALVEEAVAVYATELREVVRSSVPSWPLGLPQWDAAWIALALRGTGEVEYVSLWNRDASEPETRISLPQFRGRDLRVSTVYPSALAPWDITWDQNAGVLTVRAASAPVSARTFRLEPAPGV